MNKEPFLTGKLIELKTSLHKWFKKTTDDPNNDADRAHRNAQELIWTLQERFGYSGIRRDQDQ